MHYNHNIKKIQQFMHCPYKYFKVGWTSKLTGIRHRRMGREELSNKELLILKLIDNTVQCNSKHKNYYNYSY
jgi:hypothetical protein